MKDWHQLSLIKKIILGIIITVLALLSPELMFFIDVGGLEMAFSFLLVYYKSFFEWLAKRRSDLDEFLLSCQIIIRNSVLMKPKIFSAQSVVSGFALFITGSMLYSLLLMAPFLFIQNIY